MTTIDTFYRKECDKIDASDVNAYIDAKLNPENPTELVISSPWGDIKVDLTPAVKAAETVTHLSLDPADDPTHLRYDNEAGQSECISGEDLANLIGENNG